MRTKPRLLDFFAGAGLVTEAVKPHLEVTWANDISDKKAAVYAANHGCDHFHLGSISDIRGIDLPSTDAAWASFPCQDLSLAGAQAGLRGARSGLVWEWLRVIDEMPRRPRVLVAENVLGLVASAAGNNYRALHLELVNRGYKVGALVLDASDFLPHSRPRVFVIACDRELNTHPLESALASWCHPQSVLRAATGLPGWVFWKLPAPDPTHQKLDSLIEWDAPVHDEADAKRNLAMIAPQHQTRLLQELTNGFKFAPGYKRTRQGRQVLELRFDGIAGCLRTPEGGSSRQFLVLKRDGLLTTRLLTARETARLMGAPDRYQLPDNYNDAYKAMGDAVAVPAVRFLAKNLLLPLCAAKPSKSLIHES